MLRFDPVPAREADARSPAPESRSGALLYRPPVDVDDGTADGSRYWTVIVRVLHEKPPATSVAVRTCVVPATGEAVNFASA